MSILINISIFTKHIRTRLYKRVISLVFVGVSIHIYIYIRILIFV